MINSLSLRYGLILGAISLAVNIIMYLSGINVMAMGVIGAVWLVAMLVMWIVFALRVRKANDQSFTFSEGLQSLFIIGTITIVAGAVWQILLTQVIDPDYTARMLEESMAMVENMGVQMNDEMLEELQKQATEGTSVSGQLTGVLINIAVMTVIAALVALIIKKEKNQAAMSGVM